MAKKNIVNAIIGFAVLLIVATTLYGGIAIVAPAERGVLVMLGQVQGGVLSPGVHFHPPFISVIKKYSVVPKGMNATFSVGKDGAITKDMQTVGSQVTVFYRYDEERILDAITKYSDSILENAITRSLVAAVKEVVGKYSIYSLIENQDKITVEVNESLTKRLESYPIELTQLTISNWDWSDDFDKQIKETMNRTQQVRQAEQDLKLAETNAQKQVAEEARTNQKEEDFKFACAEAADAMNEALAAYATWKGIDVSDLGWDADMCASIVDMVVNFKDLLSVLGMTEDKKPVRKTKARSGDDTFDAAVSKFFKEFGIT